MGLSRSMMAVGLVVAAMFVAAPAGAESRTVSTSVGNTLLFDYETGAQIVVTDRPDVDYVGGAVAYTQEGLEVQTYSRAPAPAGVVVTHMLFLEGRPGDSNHIVVFRSNWTAVDVITEASDERPWSQARCAAEREEEGVRISVRVPLECLPHLGDVTRFRFDAFLWEHPGASIPGDQWSDSIPAAGGFTLYRGARPSEAPALETDGPFYDEAGVVGTINRLYHASLGRAPDVGGLAYWLQTAWGGTPLEAIANQFTRSPEFSGTYGQPDDADFVDLVYRNVLDREPDADGRAYWHEQLAGGMPRGNLMLLFADSREFSEATAAHLPPGYRRPG